MVEVELRSIKINDTGDRQYITLGEREGGRTLTIVIGYGEAQAIDRFVKGLEVPRPMTHELAASLVAATGASVVAIEVSALREGTFFATIRLKLADGSSSDVDSRPSDAIALATALGAPLFIAEDVLEEAANPLE